MKERLQAQLTATKQQHILDAAARVFAEKGFHAATIKDVAAAAGVAHGSIYNYFENKEALLLGLFDLMTARALPEHLPAPPHAGGLGDSGDARAILRATLGHPLAMLTRDNAELFRVVFSEALVNRAFAERLRRQVLDPMIETTVELLGRVVFAHETPPADLDLRVRATSGLVLGIIVQRVLHDDLLERRWDDVPDLLADVLLHGLKGASR